MKVAIAGYGVEGESNYTYWHNLGADITIFDEKEPSRPIPEGITMYIGADAFSKLDGFDVVVRTAGLSPDKIVTNGKIWSATNEFFAKCPAPIIGVTGTKGKGTTCSLIAVILKSVGKTIHLVGNIGVPALSILGEVKPDDIVVFELSSFQLWDLEKSPETAVILMIEPDHMDMHASMDEYVNAKANIARYQKPDDLLIYHPTNQYSAEIAAQAPASKKKYLTPEGAYLKDDQIVIAENVICSVSEVGLIGAHNLENICAAITAAWRYTQDLDAIKRAIIGFKGLPHRLEFVREVNSVKYYNDSFSSAPGATIAAIRSFEEPEILICGGFDRDLDYTELAQAIAEQQNIKKVLLIGQTKQAIAESFTATRFTKYHVLETANMNEIVQAAKKEAKPGDVVILSPGCASFDMFKDFKDRGEQFKQIVEAL